MVRKASLIVAALVTISARGSLAADVWPNTITPMGWVQIGNSSTDVMLEKSAFSPMGEKRLWLRYEHKEALNDGSGPDGNVFWVQSSVELDQYNCDTYQYKTLQRTDYQWTNMQGKIKDIPAAQFGWSYATPSTFNEVAATFACDRMLKRK